MGTLAGSTSIYHSPLASSITHDNNYFNDTYQGIPIGGYTKMIEAMLGHENIEVELNVDFFAKKMST